ncbi:MAG: ATP-binding protein [Verrucomicrobia bacterium]|nr:ATP-binding protein [Verrucomicrobiota bacterium]
MSLRGRYLYSLLAAVWALVILWQGFEHLRVRQSARDELINRAKDISNTAGSVMHALRRFGVVPRDRLEPALKPLIKPGDVDSIALLNAEEEVVAVVGEPIAADLKTLVPSGAPYWSDRSVALMNLVELGTNQIASAGISPAPEAEPPGPVIVVNEMFGRGTNRPSGFSSRPPPPEGEPPAMDAHAPPPPDADSGSNQPPRRRSHRGDRDGRPPFGRPFWMSEVEYKAALQKQGVHSFVIVLPTTSMQAAVRRDLWLRLFIASLVSLSVVGLGLAWRNLGRSAELELRLVRAAELNTRLKEMNFAAAGLAHETKNPLNIIRGLAQMISKRDDAPPEIREKSRSIVDEADRVTAQLNDFINFSRPREVRRVTVPLNSAVGEVVRALGHDFEDKAIKMTVAENLPAIEADEQLLRQALFNLLLNATQAVERGGEIHIAAGRSGANEATLEIRDNGPGVPAENRTDIFKPYFTTTQKGTGLGLAVVQQIVLAHGWEIECVPNEPRGAVFRISHLRVMPGA